MPNTDDIDTPVNSFGKGNENAIIDATPFVTTPVLAYVYVIMTHISMAWSLISTI